MPHLANNRGSTLIELPFALSLIAISLISSFGLFAIYTRSFAQSGDQIRARLVSESIIDDIVTYYYAGGHLSVGTYDWEQDATHFNFTPLLIDNGVSRDAVAIMISTPATFDYQIDIETVMQHDIRYRLRRRLLTRLR